MKLLKPSMREKKRYLLLKGDFSKESVDKAILKYIGVLGYAKASPTFITKNILAVNRGELEKVKASFAFEKKIIVARVSGTLKQLKKG